MSGLGPQTATLGPMTTENAPTSRSTGTGRWLAGNPAPCLVWDGLSFPWWHYTPQWALGLLPTHTILGFQHSVVNKDPTPWQCHMEGAGMWSCPPRAVCSSLAPSRLPVSISRHSWKLLPFCTERPLCSFSSCLE